MKKMLDILIMNNWNFYILYGGKKPQWTFLQHNGPMFPESYKQHNISIIINNEEIKLSEIEEEYATMYARYIDTDYIKNSTFNKNFLHDFKKNIILNAKKSKTQLGDIINNIKSLNDIDFSLIKKYLDKEKDIKNNLSKYEKENIKKQNEILEEPYKFCIIDGVQQSVGNYKIEPPGIFIGRGNHPKIGRIKKRILPEDVTINISKDAIIPEPNLKEHKWKQIIHDRNVIWLASWKDNISDKIKYVFTSFDSIFKSKNDEQKFNLARDLKKKVHKIRETYYKQLKDPDFKIMQLATALYFIDELALRVGGNKDKNEEADTVGVTSLRIEHISLLENNIIKLDFLGKDSVRYFKKIKIDEQVYNNLKQITENKSNKDELFDLINANILNEYLNSFMKGLTAKVWRTFNASLLFQKELNKINENELKKIDSNEKINYLLAQFNIANSAVALLCNHQKNINSSIENVLDKIKTRIKELKDKKKNIKDKDKLILIDKKIKSLQLKKEIKIKMKNVSLGTSKANYIDPRIIFAFIKKYDIPSEKIFTKSLIKRFDWASTVDQTFEF
jgi:DNA topoisomerase-1